LRKAEDERQLERHRSKWEDNIKVDHIEVGQKNVDWINLAEDRQWQTIVNTVMNFQVP
jgi:hypothetical protein